MGRNDPKCYQNWPFGVSGRPWAKIIRNVTKTDNLKHLGCSAKILLTLETSGLWRLIFGLQHRRVSFREASKAQNPRRVLFKDSWKAQNLRKVSFRDAWGSRGRCWDPVAAKMYSEGRFWDPVGYRKMSPCKISRSQARSPFLNSLPDSVWGKHLSGTWAF